jgi:RNA polymerase sigma-70 factor (ECF subfamily)
MYSLSVPDENAANGKADIKEEMGRLMDAYGRDVMRISWLYLKDRHRAEDAFQEVFLRVYKRFEGFKGMSSEKTWIISITINVCKDILKSSWLKRVLPFGRIREESTFGQVDDTIIRLDERRILLGEVMSLSPILKDVIILYYYKEFNTVEISKILDIPEGTVRSRLHKAREVLRNKIGGRMEYDG